MKAHRRSLLEMLDDTLRWTGIPARVRDQMSNDPSDFKYQPLRWTPILPIAFSCTLFLLSLIWPPPLDRLSTGVVISLMVTFWGSLMAMVPSIHTYGPLGKPSMEDDEREAALRKDSFMFGLWLLAALNCLGQPVLMMLSSWHHWQTARSFSVVLSAFMLNVALFACLPTLYASWKLRRLPKE